MRLAALPRLASLPLMKTRTLLAWCSLALLTPVLAQPDLWLTGPTPTPTPTPTPAPTPTPTKPPVKKPEPIGVIEGIAVPRGVGFFGVAVVNGNFKLTFYNAKKKPVAPDVVRAALRWNASYKLGDERVVLLPDGEGKSLTSAKVIRPPLNFKLFITLITEGAAEDAGESFVVDFRG
jgi:hypothetical protein